jgi:hypothetical protein
LGSSTNLESFLQNFLGLGAADSAVDSDLFVTTDAKGPDGVAGLGEDGRLAGQLLQHLTRLKNKQK